MRTKLVVGNWKMHGGLRANAVFLEQLLAGVDRLDGVEVGLCVPFPYLQQMQSKLAGSQLVWGAQNVSEHDSGAYTGEVSAGMLADFECCYVIVGHSERRAIFGETDEVVADKYMKALAAGMRPILCVGETLVERESGKTLAVIESQLSVLLERVGVSGFAGAVIAYEPVWAIGTGRTAMAEQVEEVHAAIRKVFGSVAATVRILYGGSVKAVNSKDLFSIPNVDGGLVGGASLVAEEFLGVCSGAVAALRVS